MTLVAALVIAQACWFEATYRTDDCAAIAHVIVKRAERAHVTPAQMAHAYSLNKKTPRAARARALPAAIEPRDIPKWEALVATAQGVLDGTVPNPCPRAVHWGSPHLAPDVARAERAIRAHAWVVVRCKKATANRFFAIARRSHGQAAQRVVRTRSAGDSRPRGERRRDPDRRGP